MSAQSVIEDDECPSCGGEGYVYYCIDGCCAYAESGCDLCSIRCDWCNSPTARPQSQRDFNDPRTFHITNDRDGFYIADDEGEEVQATYGLMIRWSSFRDAQDGLRRIVADWSEETK